MEQPKTPTRRYFGTDGIRGRVGEGPITPEFVMRLGWAAGRVLGRQAVNGRRSVIIGKDTRVSGYMFESALEAGLSAGGIDIKLLGPMPTPAIAYLTRTFNAQAGIVISASHNPYDDNGIKFFDTSGSKLADAVEYEIECELDTPLTTCASRDLGKATRVTDAAGRYIEFCKGTFPSDLNLRGLKIVVDCAHGATYHVAPAVFAELGATVETIGAAPDGFNINDGCGATAPDAMCRKVVESGADLGIALDGDGDRLIMCDADGRVLDGDDLTYIIARQHRARGRLDGAVVGTLMSNFGLEVAIGELGLEFHRAKVGDRYILEMLKAGGWRLGGETSGHIICLDYTTTGDGVIAALQVLAAMADSARSLADLADGMEKYPQRMINVRFSEPCDVMQDKVVRDAVRSVEAELAGDGRVVLRPSGTEPVIRVMVEGQDAVVVERMAESIAEAVRNAVSRQVDAA